MATIYTEIPHNWNAIKNFVETDVEIISRLVFSFQKVFFYDTCSFRRHSNLDMEHMQFLLNYFKKHDSVIVVTRCILMELASHSGNLNLEYISYFNELYNAGINIAILYEENIFEILSVCFSTKESINEYLSWAVRMLNAPVSTIAETLKSDLILNSEVKVGKNSNSSDLYKRFFSAVRANKESGDNLGEEILGICIHILSHLPGMENGKLCIVTDDKGASGKIDSLMKKTKRQYAGAKIIIYSTPKLVQNMYQEDIGLMKDNIVAILSEGTNSNIVVMGTTVYDLEVNEKISRTCDELAELIMEPNGINIVF